MAQRRRDAAKLHIFFHTRMRLLLFFAFGCYLFSLLAELTGEMNRHWSIMTECNDRGGVLRAKCQTEGAFLLDYLRATRKWLANTGKFVHLYPVESEWVRNRADFTDVKSWEK